MQRHVFAFDLLFIQGAHGLVVPPWHISFLLQEPPEGKLEHKIKNIKKRKT